MAGINGKVVSQASSYQRSFMSGTPTDPYGKGVRDVMKDKQLLWSNTRGKKKKDTWHFRYGQPEILLYWLLDYQQVLMI